MAMKGAFKVPAPSVFRYHSRLGAKGTRATYEQAHAAWRARAISDFSYGPRDKNDPTVVWTVDGTEYPQKATAEVVEHVLRALEDAGIVEAELGSSWCGYRALKVVAATGLTTLERYDGTRVITEVIA